MLSTIMDTIFNGLLMGTSGYVMYVVNPNDHPFAFGASAAGFIHGFLGMYNTLFDSEGDGTISKLMNNGKTLTTTCMEIISVPLVNIDLYMNSKQSSYLALGHGLFIIPLAFDVHFKVFANEEDEGASTAILKDLTIVGNIVSLLFFAVNENNVPAGIMALSALFSYYGSQVMEKILSGSGENSTLFGYSVFFGFLPQAINLGGAS